MARQFACEPFVAAGDLTCDCDLEEVDINALVDAVSDFLFHVSGGVMSGRCQTTVRPCADNCSCGARSCNECACCVLDAIPLAGPLPVVDEVWIDGVKLATSTYQLIDGNRLIRTGPGSPPPSWPGSQRLYRPLSAEGTFGIIYTSGLEVDFITSMAAAEVVCDLAATLPGTTHNQLDPATVAASLDGLQLERDPNVLESRGFTWLSRFMKTYAPMGVPSAVWSPEIDEGWTLHVTG